MVVAEAMSHAGSLSRGAGYDRSHGWDEGTGVRREINVRSLVIWLLPQSYIQRWYGPHKRSVAR